MHWAVSTPILWPQRISGGMSYHSKGPLAFCIGAGWGNERIRFWQSPAGANEFSVREVRAEVRYYVLKDRNASWYTGGELFHTHLSRVRTFDWYRPLNTFDDVIYDSAVQHRWKTGLHAVNGFDLSIMPRFYINVAAGLGVAHRVLRYRDVWNPRIREFWREDGLLFQQGFRNESQGPIVHFTMRLRVGFVLWSDKVDAGQ